MFEWYNVYSREVFVMLDAFSNVPYLTVERVPLV